MKLAIAVIMIWLTAPAFSQQLHHGHSPYTGSQTREIKALSDQQIADLRNGRGMGLALAAELNGYPGPLHVLELADKLGLDNAQLQQTKKLFDYMQAEAIRAGEQLIAKESLLDRQFARRHITPESLDLLTTEIGRIQGQLRSLHLKYHLATDSLLTGEQKRQYADLRGYR